MKVGVRKPSIKKSIKARTTGKYKRKLKRMVNPLYGKKGMGWVKNPKKAFKNKVYHKTTISARKATKGFAGIFVGFFMLCWWMIKWSCILCFYMFKYLFLGLAWLFVAIYNGIVTLVEWIINRGREENPDGAIEEIEDNQVLENEDLSSEIIEQSSRGE